MHWRRHLDPSRPRMPARQTTRATDSRDGGIGLRDEFLLRGLDAHAGEFLALATMAECRNAVLELVPAISSDLLELALHHIAILRLLDGQSARD